MSDLMLYGVLRMPYDLTMANELSRRQFYDRVQEAVRRMEVAEAKLEELGRTAPTVEVHELPALPEPVDHLAEADGFNVVGAEDVFTGNQMRAYGEACARAALINALLQADSKINAIAEQRASKPPAREAAERQSIAEDQKFRELLDEFAYRASERRAMGGGFGSADNEELAEDTLIAHIDTWAGAAPAAGNTAQPTKAYITERAAEFIRSGCSTSALFSAVPTEAETVAVCLEQVQRKEE